ncbi:MULTISPECIES: hypothetical protein [Microbulbifer]|uniref:Lipoprotein n=1 Tax=Microbulbifer celer TaxID=435905 RepID=A0ABW3U833_9GAMM|nr:MULTISPECIES: hypothetical protein [Microbulbifer]UFN57249.1 hypothetical protein LPW13_17035 [Microbulbifer celer]
MQKLSSILLAAAVAAGIVAGCTATESKEESHAIRTFSQSQGSGERTPEHLYIRSEEAPPVTIPANAPRRSPKSLNVNGAKFRCYEREMDNKIVVRCVRQT